MELSTVSPKFLQFVNALLIVATGALFTILIFDTIDFLSKPQEYEHLIGKGSTFGCNYQSASNYLLVSAERTVLIGVAFVIGFLFKDRIWSVSSRVITISLMYLIDCIITRILC